MRKRVGDFRWRVPSSDLEQSSGLDRELLRRHDNGFALVRGLTPDHHAFERQ
jgi:hypothetical protein